MDFIFGPWPWYVGGPMIGLVFLSLLFLDKSFGMSSNLRTFCAICGAGKASSFFKFDWKAQRWNLIVVLGAIIGGWLGANLLSHDNLVPISEVTIHQLESINIKTGGKNYVPDELFGIEALKKPKILAFLVLGGFFVGLELAMLEVVLLVMPFQV